MERVVNSSTNGQESFNWVFNQSDKRGRKVGFFCFCFFLIFSYKLLLAPRPQPPKHTRSRLSLTFALGGKQSKIVYLCSLPWDLANDTLINICSLREKEKPNFFCDTCTTPLRLDIFLRRAIKALSSKVALFLPFLEIKVLSKTCLENAHEFQVALRFWLPSPCPACQGELLISRQISNPR